MAKLSMECKKMMIEEISRRLNEAETIIVTNYKGLSAQDMNALRRELGSISGEYIVVKDAMAKKALGDGRSKDIKDMIVSEVGIALKTQEDPSVISKVLVKFAKDHASLKIRGGIMSGGVLSVDSIKELASLPSRDVLLGKLANVLNAPIQGLAGALNAIICKILYVLNAVKEKKEKEPKPVEVPAKVEENKEELKPGETKEDKPVEAKEEPKEETKQEEKKEEPKVEDKPTEDNKEVSNG